MEQCPETAQYIRKVWRRAGRRAEKKRNICLNCKNSNFYWKTLNLLVLLNDFFSYSIVYMKVKREVHSLSTSPKTRTQGHKTRKQCQAKCKFFHPLLQCVITNKNYMFISSLNEPLKLIFAKAGRLMNPPSVPKERICNISLLVSFDITPWQHTQNKPYKCFTPANQKTPSDKLQYTFSQHMLRIRLLSFIN